MDGMDYKDWEALEAYWAKQYEEEYLDSNPMDSDPTTPLYVVVPLALPADQDSSSSK
ncbi:MAG: hypothetical protein ACXQTZ_00635 [Candidatus Alkanophagales archaeon]